MGGTVFLKTNQFEVKLEGITFKTKDFASLCKTDFLFPDGKIWIRPPTVGVEVMRHPRDPSIVLVLMCFGVGCVIIRFRSGEPIPKSIAKFLSDERINFVGYGIQEKEELFPFKRLGLSKRKADIGYLAATVLNDPKYKKCDLSVLARKLLHVKRIVGFTDSSSFGRHEQIKCAICHLFITTMIAMTLLGIQDKKKLQHEPIRHSFINTLNSLPLMNEGWFNVEKAKQDDKRFAKVNECNYNLDFRPKCKKAVLGVDPDFAKPNEDDHVNHYVRENESEDDLFHFSSDEGDFSDYKGHKVESRSKFIQLDHSDSTKDPLKRIFMSPSSSFESLCYSPPLNEILESPTRHSENFSPSPPVKGILKCSSTHSKCFSPSSPLKGILKFPSRHYEELSSSPPLKGILKLPSGRFDGFNLPSPKEGSINYPTSDSDESPYPSPPLKGILKYPSSGSESCSPSPSKYFPREIEGQNITRSQSLKRANSKGFKVTFNLNDI